MKVKIGKYPKHRWYHNWLYNKFGYSAQQSVNVRIDHWDTWSMDYTLAYIVLPMLIQLKETKQGAPFVDDEDVPDCFKSTNAPEKDNSWDTDAHHFHRWDYVLDEMIFAFDSKVGESADWEEQFYSGECDRINVPVDKDGDPVASEDDPNFFGYRWDKGPNDTFEIDVEGKRAYQERIDNGFRLFGKYYNALWD